MASDEQFSLCWNNFHANMSAGFHGLLSRGDLVDVTLAAEGRLLQAHKLVLSVCSPYFQEMFKMNPTQHPIVFLKDVSHSALRDLLQFMYQGEVNVKQEELASFISTAEQLQVKGLTGSQNDEAPAPSKPKLGPTPRPGPRSAQQRVSKSETESVESKTTTPLAVKRPNRPSITSNSTPQNAKRKCLDPLEAGPSNSNAKDEFVTIPDDEDNNAVAPKMEPEFVSDAVWEDDDEGPNNDDTNFGEDDSNLGGDMGFDASTGDASIAGAPGEGGAIGDAQGWFYITSQKGRIQLVAEGHVFNEDTKTDDIVGWRCTKYYTKSVHTGERECSMRIVVKSGVVWSIKGGHNHGRTYDPLRHGSRYCSVDPRGKYRLNFISPPQREELKAAARVENYRQHIFTPPRDEPKRHMNFIQNVFGQVREDQKGCLRAIDLSSLYRQSIHVESHVPANFPTNTQDNQSLLNTHESIKSTSLTVTPSLNTLDIMKSSFPTVTHTYSAKPLVGTSPKYPTNPQSPQTGNITVKSVDMLRSSPSYIAPASPQIRFAELCENPNSPKINQDLST